MLFAIRDRTAPRPHPHFSGWSILGVGGLALLLAAPAQTYGFSVFIDPMLADLGLSRSLVAAAYTVATLLSAVAVVSIGNLIDRRGHRSVMMATTIVYVLALLLMGSVVGPISLLVGFTLLRVTGSSVLTLAARTLVGQWFARRRGRAVSLINLGKMLGMAAIPPASALMIESIGWRSAWRVSALLVAVLIPVTLLFVRGRPEDVGQYPDGERPAERPAEASGDGDTTESWSLGQALRTRTLWLLLAASFVPSMLTNGLSFNQISILTKAGLSPTAAATTFAVESAVALPMTLVAGWLTDRIGPRYVLALGNLTLGLGLVCLAFATNAELAILFGVLRGLTTGAWILGSEVAWPVYFGRRYLGSILGLSFGVAFTGAAIGPLPFGITYDLTGGYDEAIWGLAVLPVFGMVCALLVRPPARSDQGNGGGTATA